MTRIYGLVIAGGLLFGLAGHARAQLAVTVGGPYGGGVSISSNPYGYGYGYGNSALGAYSTLYPSLYGVPAPNPWPYSSSLGYVGPGYVGNAPGTNYYSAGYSGYAPSTSYYSSSYSGYAPSASYYSSAYSGYAPSAAFGVYAPAVTTYTYPSYGYGLYSRPYYGGIYGARQGLIGGLVNRALRW